MGKPKFRRNQIGESRESVLLPWGHLVFAQERVHGGVCQEYVKAKEVLWEWRHCGIARGFNNWENVHGNHVSPCWYHYFAINCCCGLRSCDCPKIIYPDRIMNWFWGWGFPNQPCQYHVEICYRGKILVSSYLSWLIWLCGLAISILINLREPG